MASSPSSPPPTKTKEFPNPPTFIKRVLRNAIRINDLAHEVDASQSAPNTDLFPDFLKSALLNLETNALIFKTVIPNVSAEEAARLEHLRAANEAALVGVRAFGDADKKARAAATRAEKKATKQAIPDADPSQTPQTLAATTPITYAPGTRLTKAGIPKKKSGPKPGSHRTPKEERPKPTAAEIEQKKARGVGQPEALALLAEHFASTPVRQLSPVKRKTSEGEEVKSPDSKKKAKGRASETKAAPNEESKAEMRAIKKMKKSRLSKGTPAEEKDQPAISTTAPPMNEETEEAHASPAKKHKTMKEERKEKKETRKSDVSMKDATPITSPVSTPIPSSTSKSRKEKGRFADKFHPYKKPTKHGKQIPSKDDTDAVADVVVQGEAGNGEVYETEDITAEVDEKMRRHHARAEKAARAKELGINPSEKHKRESLGTAGPSPKHSQNSIQGGTSSAKKWKTKKSREEKNREEEDGKFKGVVGDIERKRKSKSPAAVDGGKVVVEKKDRSAEEKKRRKEEKAAKKARKQAGKGEQVDGMGDVVMSGGGMSE